jgi:hypothetical protein
MGLKSTIQHYADIRSNERKMVGMLFLQSLLLGFSTSFYFVAANSSFIKKANVGDIPYAYIIAGAAGFLLVSFFKYVLKRFGSIFGFVSVLILFAIACLLLYIGHLREDEKSDTALYLAYAGFIFIFPFANLFVLGFSGICLQLFNLSQSKRLLALIGIGEVIASIIGYLSVPFITKIMGSPVHLFLLSGVFILLSAVPVMRIYMADKTKFIVSRGTVAIKKFNFALLKKERFYLSLTVVTFFSVLAIYFTDYTYLVSVRTLSEKEGMKVPDIVAVLFCIIKTGELLFSFFSSNIISTRGMKFSLLLLPILLLLFSLLAVVSHFIFDDVMFFVIAFFLMAKWSDRVIRKGVYAPSTKVLYQVTAPAERIRLQTSIEGTISQLSIILSGVILLLVSKVQKGSIDNFFYIMSFICLLFSALWVAFVFGLYSGYKKRIHEYLHTIKQVAVTSQQHSITVAFDNWLNQQKGILGKKEIASMQEIFGNDIGYVEELNKKALEKLIISYNPSLGSASELDDEMMARKIIRFFFSNDNFFSRLLIIWYLEMTGRLSKPSLIAEMYEAADFMVRTEIVAALNRMHYTPTENDRFYFTELCHSYVAEIMWTEPAIADIADLTGTDLADILEEHASDCKNHLLELLKILYGNETVHVVQQVLNETDKGNESRIFAVELLDNILEPSLKEIIIPVFEPIPQQMRWTKLNQQFLIYHLSPTERLKEILIRNFKLTDIRIKQVALKCYHELVGDDEVVTAFSSSQLEELKADAGKLQSNTEQHQYFLKQQLLEKLNLTGLFKQQHLSYLSRYGMLTESGYKANASQLQHGFAKKAFEHVVQVDQGNRQKVDIDVLGLAMLFKLKQADATVQ